MKRILLAAVLSLPLLAHAAERVVDPARSELSFSVKQMGVAVSGSFKNYRARLDWDAAAPNKSSANIEIETASLSTGDDEADTVAREKVWLDSAGFPKASFRSSSLKALGGGRYEARGQLSIKGQSREMVLPYTLKDAADGSALISGQFKLQRSDFGIGGGEWNEGDLVSPEVEVRFKLVLKAP